MDDKNEETEDATCTDHQFQITQKPVANTNTSESSLPSLTEMLAAISESAELTRDLQALMATSPCTSETLHRSTNKSPSNTPKAKQEVAEFDSTTLPEVNSPQSESWKPSTVTTNLTCYDENLQSCRNISLKHKDSLKFNVKVENCENVLVGDGAQVNIYRSHKRPLNQDARHRLRHPRRPRGRSTANNSSVQADGDVNLSGSSTKNSVKNSATRNNVEEKIKTKWRFPMFLSDFTDAESLHNSIDQWLVKLIPFLLSELAQDLDADFESVKKLLEEAGNLRESSTASCILKVKEAIEISILVCNEESKKYDVLLTETQFVLAEFYAKEDDFLSALRCLKTLEGRLSDDTEKSRLYAREAKVMEHCLENSVDFTSCEDEFTCASNAPASDRYVDEIALCYEKALKFSHNEPSEHNREIIQICCYLGKAAVYMRCWKGLVETTRNLPEGRKNLLLTEKLFDKISPALKCQFYLAEASLLYYEERYKMAADKIQMACKIAEEENFLDKRCLGSKRLHLLLAKLDKSTDVSKPEEELDDLNSVED